MSLFIIIIYFTFSFILFCISLHQFIFYILSKRLRKSSELISPPHSPISYPAVTVQLPVFNEANVISRLIDSICKLNYPKHLLEIQVLDDSNDITKDIVAKLVAKYKKQGFDIVHIHRSDRAGFKAGALQNGLELCRGEFIAIFDADFIPNPDFLLYSLPCFENPKVAMAQTRWTHLNEHKNLLTRIQARLLDCHFAIEQHVRFCNGMFINFNGTAGIWRKSAVVDSGGWQSDTLAEDLDLSYRAQLRGWKLVYLNEVESPAELPENARSALAQQYRWTKGAIEAGKKNFGALCRSKFPLKVKIEGLFHLFSNLSYPLIILIAMMSMPLALIKTNNEMLAGFINYAMLFSVSLVFIYLYYSSTIKSELNIGNKLLFLPAILGFGAGVSLNNTKAVFDALRNKQTPFVRTPKSGDLMKVRYSSGIKQVSIFELIIIIYFIISIALTIFSGEFSVAPFQLLFLIGFTTINFPSIALVLGKIIRKTYI